MNIFTEIKHKNTFAKPRILCNFEHPKSNYQNYLKKDETKSLLPLVALAGGITASAQAAYDFSKLQPEKLGRGVVAVRENPETVNISWRYLSSDPENQAFDVYRDGKKSIKLLSPTLHTSRIKINQTQKQYIP